MRNQYHTYHIQIKGLVQGVGFRPFIYRLACQHGIKGWVNNTDNGIAMEITTQEHTKNAFVADIRSKAPPAGDIADLSVITHNTVTEYKHFTIRRSRKTSSAITEISPDIAVCDDCLHDMQSQPHRLDYPFINCTHCGPRFTIIKDIPYDRSKTTMAPFQMCEQCRSEYTDIADRRFHAQPVACNDCGPAYTLKTKNKKRRDIQRIITNCSQIIEKGGIIAIKGLGGYFLIGDAYNNHVVEKIRAIKQRDRKPFAVMFRNLQAIQEHANVNSREAAILQSWQRPVVLLKQKKSLAKAINGKLNTLGCILPYMPFHYQLFNKLKTDAIVYTSGNLSASPVITDNKTAESIFAQQTDALLTYNRQIHNHADDSVVFAAGNKKIFIRRARGVVPKSIAYQAAVHKIIATGADQKNCFALGVDQRIIMSQHIGELGNYDTFKLYQSTIERFKKIFRCTAPAAITADAHPDYYSTQYAGQLAQKLNIPLIKTYHHHAHIASVLAEHQMNEKVIGISMDGTGYGSDGNIWGGEFFICNLANFERHYHFEYVPIPGGESAVHEPWKMAVSYLLHTFIKGPAMAERIFGNTIDREKIQIVSQLLKSNTHSPLTSSAGRLFDTVSALLQICTHAHFEAQAPMELEAAIDHRIKKSYPFELQNNQISFKKTISQILADLDSNVKKSVIAAKFHQTIVEIIVKIAILLREEKQINHVALSGGMFQNRYILNNTLEELQKAQFNCLINEKVPPNDGGIALGQIAIATQKMQNNDK